MKSRTAPAAPAEPLEQEPLGPEFTKVLHDNYRGLIARAAAPAPDADGLRALLAKATPGGWKWMIAKRGGHLDYTLNDDDARLVCAAVNALPGLLDMIAAQASEIAMETTRANKYVQLADEQEQRAIRAEADLAAARADADKLRAAIRAISVRGPDGDGLVWIVCTMPNGDSGAISIHRDRIPANVFTAWREAAQAAIDAARAAAKGEGNG